jgi:hypothetical protein
MRIVRALSAAERQRQDKRIIIPSQIRKALRFLDSWPSVA